jgi:hypothetical protein
MLPLTRHIDVFADYHQFYVCDVGFKTNTGIIWDEITSDRMLAVGPDLIAVGTARNMTVPVELEVLPSEPVDDFNAWDQVIACSVMFPTGTLILFGCAQEPSEAERLRIAPGSYAARVSYARLADLSDDGLEGDDHYRVQLWPGPPAPVNVLKRRPT